MRGEEDQHAKARSSLIGGSLGGRRSLSTSNAYVGSNGRGIIASKNVKASLRRAHPPDNASDLTIEQATVTHGAT